MPLHDRADPRFIWNSYLLQDLTARPEHHKFCLPIIMGCILLIFILRKLFLKLL
jgi:hypothetical protein